MNRGATFDEVRRLRGLAGGLVVTGALSVSSTLLAGVAAGLGNPLHVGTDLFLVLSGLLLARSVEAGGSGLALIARRMMVLLPMLAAGGLAATLVLAVFAVLPGTPWAVGFFTVAPEALWAGLVRLMTGTAIGATPLPFLLSSLVVVQPVLAWTVVAGLAMLVGRAVGGDRAGSVTLGWIAALVAVLGAGLRMAAGLGIDVGGVGVLAEGRFDVLAAGIVAYGLRGALPNWLAGSRAARAGLVALALVVVAVAGGAAVSLGSAVAAIVAVLLVLPAVMLTVVEGREGSQRGGVLAWLGDRALAGLVLLKPAMALAWLLLFNVGVALVEEPWLYAVGQAIVTLGILLPASDVVHRFIETPLRRLAHATGLRQHSMVR